MANVLFGRKKSLAQKNVKVKPQIGKLKRKFHVFKWKLSGKGEYLFKKNLLRNQYGKLTKRRIFNFFYLPNVPVHPTHPARTP